MTANIDILIVLFASITLFVTAEIRAQKQKRDFLLKIKSWESEHPAVPKDVELAGNNLCKILLDPENLIAKRSSAIHDWAIAMNKAQEFRSNDDV